MISTSGMTASVRIISSLKCWIGKHRRLLCDNHIKQCPAGIGVHIQICGYIRHLQGIIERRHLFGQPRMHFRGLAGQVRDDHDMPNEAADVSGQRGDGGAPVRKWPGSVAKATVEIGTNSKPSPTPWIILVTTIVVLVTSSEKPVM